MTVAKRKPAAKKAAAGKPATTRQETPAEPAGFDAAVYLDPDPGGVKTDAGGRPVVDKGGRPVTKD